MAATRPSTTAPTQPPSAPPPHRERDRPITDLEGAAEDAALFAGPGIQTIHELEAIDAETLSERSGVPRVRVKLLQSQARLLDVSGVGPRVARALVGAEILTIPDLARAEPRRVAEAVATAAAGPGATPTPEGLRNAKSWVRAARNHPAVRPNAPSPAGPPPERVVVIPTRVYWTVLVLSCLFLFVAVGFYRDYLDAFLFGVGLVFYYVTLVLAIVAIAWCVFGLLRRGRVVHRTTSGTRSLVSGVAESFRERSDDNEGAMDRLASAWGQRFGALGRAIVWIVKLPYRIVVWAWYTSEKLVWQLTLILYDIVYYPTYAAWLLVHWAVRTALRIAAWALGVAWKVLRLPLFLPGIKGAWRRNLRPRILTQWRAALAARHAASAKRIERGRRLALVRGENPDRWQADFKHRRGFPLPHPEKGRVRIRKRIRHISDVQKARREGKPVPRSRAKEAKARGAGPNHEAAGHADEPLAFLPADLRKRIETVLANGKVDEEERRDLVDAIEQRDELTADQKDRVRRVVEAWSAQDRAAPA